MNKNIYLKIDDIQNADDILLMEMQKEKEMEEAREKQYALDNSTFKIGDIVRCCAGQRHREQAMMIVDVCTIYRDEELDWKSTDYMVMDKEGRKWRLSHSEGTHEDASPDEVVLIKRAE